jgi:hypothetical protein
MVKDSVVMVLDCGGGTVDITVHKLCCTIDERFLCSELLPSSGGCEWGSKYVDKYFEEFLKDFFGDELYEELYEKNAVARLDILRDFEMLKRKFKGGEKERCMVKLSYLGGELNSNKLKELCKQHNENNPEKFKVKKKGAANLEISPIIM